MNDQDFATGSAQYAPADQAFTFTPDQDDLAPVPSRGATPGAQDPDWEEACRIAELLGFGQTAVAARTRSRKNRRAEVRPELAPQELVHWSQQERQLLDLLNKRAWKNLAATLTDISQQPHPFDATTLQQLHYLACTLAGGEWPALPEEDRHEGGTLVQALADLARLLQLALEEDLEWAFDQGLADLSPYLVGDRPTDICLLHPFPLAAEGLVEAILERLGERFDLERRLERRFRGARLYFRLRQLPSLRVSEQDLLALQETAGSQAFFLSFLGRQELIHWRQDPDSIRKAFEHLWNAYRQECEYTEEPLVELGALEELRIAEADVEQFREALSRGVASLSRQVGETLAAQRFLRHLWRKYLIRYASVLERIEQPECLDLLVRIRVALADEIEPELEFAIGGLARKLKRWHLVEESYLRGLVLEPDNLDAILSLAAFYKGRSRYAEARGLLSKALRLRPGDPVLLRRMRMVADRQDLQNQTSPYLTPLPDAKAPPPQDLEQLGDLALLSLAAMIQGLQLEQTAHLRAFGEIDQLVFPHEGVRDQMARDLLLHRALLVYRYSPEQSYRVQGPLFDFDIERVEWRVHVQSLTYPDLEPDAAALRLLRDRLADAPAAITGLWRQVASHELFFYARKGFQQQGWYLEVSDYFREVMDALLQHLPFKQVASLIDLAIATTRETLDRQHITLRQVAQTAIRNIQDSFEKAILRELDLSLEEQPQAAETLWSRLFRVDLTQLGSLYYQMVPGEVEFVRHG